MKMLVPVVATLVLLAGCGSDDAPVAVDPGGSATAQPTTPAASGSVRTRTIVTVMDTGSPELCLGAVAESWPPQCGGPELAGWDWAEHRGSFERSGEVRWGQYVVQGTWDGTTFTYETAIPAALYDAAAEPPSEPPVAADPLSADELQRIADGLSAELPDVQAVAVDQARVLVDVIYDDGSLQAQVDDEHGAGVVVISSALVPVAG